jgi:hypothetical protein
LNHGGCETIIIPQEHPRLRHFGATQIAEGIMRQHYELDIQIEVVC